jgi:hypothetical protein
MGNSVPIIMQLNPKDGNIINFMSLDKIGATETTMPWYKTFGAIYHDTKDDDDGQSYYYTSFVMENVLHVLKINSITFKIKWDYEYGDEAMSYYDVPGFLHQDQKDRSRMYLLGSFAKKASVVKFNKRNMDVDWNL